MVSKTKVIKNCPKSHFSISSFIRKKNEEVKKVDFFKKSPFSNRNKAVKNLEKNQNEDTDIQMKIENTNLNKSLKDSQNDEPMDIVDEEGVKKNTETNDSLDNCSTTNSDIENDKSRKKQFLIKEKIESKDDGKTDNSLLINKEKEIDINNDIQNVNEYTEEIFINLWKFF